MTIPVSLAGEGDLDLAVLERLLIQSGRDFQVNARYVQIGRANLHQSIHAFNQAARTIPYIVLADLESDECAPGLVTSWLPHGKHQNLVLRIAVRMVESWLLADRDAFAEFLGVRFNRIPMQPDRETHPKKLVVQVAGRSRLRSLKEDLVPPQDSPRSQGPNYVGQMTRFVTETWNVQRAIPHSPSLERALRAIQNFTPVLLYPLE